MSDLIRWRNMLTENAGVPVELYHITDALKPIISSNTLIGGTGTWDEPQVSFTADHSLKAIAPSNTIKMYRIVFDGNALARDYDLFEEEDPYYSGETEWAIEIDSLPGVAKYITRVELISDSGYAKNNDINKFAVVLQQQLPVPVTVQ